jgi:Ca2+-binding EF-hand superfamily protein
MEGDTFALDRAPRLESPAEDMKSFLLLLPATLLFSGCATSPQSGDATLMQRFKQADADGNGQLSRTEFSDALITDAYPLYDKTGKGYFTLQEFVAGGGTEASFRDLDRSGTGRVTLADAKANQRARDQFAMPFDGADTQRSGSLTYDEFMAYRAAAAPYVR